MPINRYKIFFFLSLLFLGSTSKAQDYCYNCDYDSLKNQLKQKKTPEEKVKLLAILLEIGSFEVVYGSVQLEYLNALIEYNKQAPSIDAAPYIKMREGVIHSQKAEWEQALASLKESVELFDRQKKVSVNLIVNIRILYNKLNRQEERFQYYTDKLTYYQVNGPIENTAPCYHGLGGYYRYKNDFNSAIKQYLKAANIYKSFYQHYYANEIDVVGTMYAEWGNAKKAAEYFNMALPILKQLKDSNNQAYIYNALTKTALKDADYDAANRYVSQEMIYSISDPNHRAIALLNKALIYLNKKESSLAYPYLVESKQIEDTAQLEFNTTRGVLETDFGFYQYYSQTNNQALAEKYLLAAYEKAVKTKSDSYILKYLKDLSDYYASQGKPDVSGKYIKDYFKLAASIEKQESAYKIARYENEEKEQVQNQHIEKLQQERAIQQATIHQRNIILWLSLAAFLLIAASLIFLYRQLHVNKKVLRALRETQSQLIQSEKMASLGELTAGIAHEIQNPLNFVTNFSDVNTELIDEMQQEMDKGNINDAKAISNDIKDNEEKINHHGKRADAIVKGMLQHSQKSAGQREPTNINALADEYLRLSYHGLRAKDKLFNADFKTDFDERIGKIEVVPQDIGRVLLNLYNNAFYSVNEKKKNNDETYKPLVSVSTRKINAQTKISIRDNGIGIPQNVLDKIYQPFFTTKPTGEGTGLGLSLSYDIITKTHNGKLEVNSVEGEFAEFIITLPIT